MSPVAILRLARSRESRTWSNGRVTVVADCYEGFWQYRVWRTVTRIAYGRPAVALPALRALLDGAV